MYAIEFRFPERSTAYGSQSVYAAWVKDSAGFARTLETAAVFDNPEAALRMLRNAYGPCTNKWGYVVKAKVITAVPV